MVDNKKCEIEDANKNKEKPMTEECFKKEFGENLRRIRKEKGVTQEALSGEKSSTLISAYEHQYKLPSLYSAYLIAESLNVTINELYGKDLSEEEKKKIKESVRTEVEKEIDELLMKKMKENAQLALLIAFDFFKIHLDLSDEDRIVLSMPKDSGTYSRRSMLEFFKDYEIVQSYLFTDCGVVDVEKKRDELFLELKKKYEDIPNWLEYGLLLKKDEYSNTYEKTDKK